MNPSYPHDPELHEPGSVAAAGGCSHHRENETDDAGACTGTAVVSFQDRQGAWQSGCTVALEQLVEHGEIEPLGQGA